jgi:large conductance mechanosensitive channel
MNKQLNSFISFIREQGVVGLAVGLAIGAQVTSTVSSIVSGIIDPIVGFIIGNQEGLAGATWTIVQAENPGDRALVIGWGSVLSSLITLAAVAAVIYFVVSGLKLDKADKKK